MANTDEPFEAAIWAQKRCVPCEGGTAPLPADEVQTRLARLPGWGLEQGALTKSFGFRNYYQTMAFVNAVAFVAHMQDHHPDLEVSYRECVVRYHTHAIDGLSENDFICAAKVEQLLQ